MKEHERYFLSCLEIDILVLFVYDVVFIIFYKFIYLFIFVCFVSSLLHTGFPQSRRAGAAPRCDVRASHHSGFSCCGARALGMRASVVVARGLSSCGTWAQ